MTDIVERLRKFVAGDALLAEEAIAEAADAIERLRAEIERLREQCEGLAQSTLNKVIEIARLREGLGVASAPDVALSEENDRLIDENKKLRDEWQHALIEASVLRNKLQSYLERPPT